MLAKENGVLSGSDLYFLVPSDNARELLFYPTSCGYYYTDDGYLIRRKDDYSNYLIFYLCEGQMTVTSQGKRELVHAGQVCFLDCHTPHSYGSMGHAEFIWLHADGSNMASFHKRLIELYGNYVFTPVHGDAIRELLYRFNYHQRNHQTQTEWQLSDQIYHLLMLMLDRFTDILPESTSPSISSSAVRNAMDYIQTHYSEPLYLEDIAGAVGVSKYHFSRVFKQECGFSPHEYLIMTRMNRAMFLLKTTDDPIKEIALQVGYQNEATFTTAFGNRVGLSPSRFRLFLF